MLSIFQSLFKIYLCFLLLVVAGAREGRVVWEEGHMVPGSHLTSSSPGDALGFATESSPQKNVMTDCLGNPGVSCLQTAVPSTSPSYFILVWGHTQLCTKDYFWLCTQESQLMVLRGPNGMAGTEPELSLCKANDLPLQYCSVPPFPIFINSGKMI